MSSVPVPLRSKLVVFDLGGVLVETARSWDHAMALAGYDDTWQIHSHRLGRAVLGLGAQYETGLIETEEFCAGVAAAAGDPFTPPDVEQILAAYSMKQFDGVSRIFDSLDDAGVVAAVLSNTNDGHWPRLAGLLEGPPEYPDVVRAQHLFASHLLGVRKPDPAIFEVVEARTGYRPQEILFFDDLEANVLGARNAGWNAIQVLPERDPVRQILDALRAYAVLD